MTVPREDVILFLRRYKEKIQEENWKPELAMIIDGLARYAQGYKNASAPAFRIGGLPDIFELMSKVPLIHRWYDRFLAMKKRALVAGLLPRVAMLPLRNIYWLEDNEVKSVGRQIFESKIGGLSVEKSSARVLIKIHRPLFRYCLQFTSSKKLR